MGSRGQKEKSRRQGREAQREVEQALSGGEGGREKERAGTGRAEEVLDILLEPREVRVRPGDPHVWTQPPVIRALRHPKLHLSLRTLWHRGQRRRHTTSRGFRGVGSHGPELGLRHNKERHSLSEERQ